MSWSLSNIDPVWFIIVLLLAVFVYYASRTFTGVLISKGIIKKPDSWKDILNEINNDEKEDEKDGKA